MTRTYTAPTPIGRVIMDDIASVTDELIAAAGPIPPDTDCYRVSDCGDYVTVDAWEDVWAGRPAWYPLAWLLADNGQYSSDDVAAMTVDEIVAAACDPDFYPEYAYFTESGEEGIL